MYIHDSAMTILVSVMDHRYFTDESSTKITTKVYTTNNNSSSRLLLLLLVVVVVEMNIIKVALSHFCCISVQSDSVSVSSQAGDSSSLVDSTKHIVSQPERTTGTAQSSVKN